MANYTTETFGDISLIHADCLDVLRELPDNAYDLAIVDCPYGDGQVHDNQEVGEDSGGVFYNRFGNPNSRFERYKSGGGAEVEQILRWQQHQQICPTYGTSEADSTSTNYPPQSIDKSVERTGGTWAAKYDKKIIGWDVAPTEEYFKELFRVTKNQIIWGANYFPNMPPTRCFIVWRKLTISEKFSMAMAEYAWTSFNRNAKVFECAPQGKKNDPRFHPTAKPIALYKWILNNFANEGDTILDTHLGSGSSAIACHELGYKMTGIEIDEFYYTKAKERLIKHQQQLTLF
jgi:site-specific DNA-methyltransferase (adenine-specific)